MSSEPIIVWEKWVDPFGKEIDDAKWTDYESKIEDISNTEDYLDEDGDVGELDSEYREIKEIRAIASPMGLIPYNELTAPGKIFNFWVAHTNFNITSTISKIIERTEGVEILDIFTRYRFRVGIGKCFNSSETMKNINDNVYSFLMS